MDGRRLGDCCTFRFKKKTTTARLHVCVCTSAYMQEALAFLSVLGSSGSTVWWGCYRLIFISMNGYVTQSRGHRQAVCRPDPTQKCVGGVERVCVVQKFLLICCPHVKVGKFTQKSGFTASYKKSQNQVVLGPRDFLWTSSRVEERMLLCITPVPFSSPWSAPLPFVLHMEAKGHLSFLVTLVLLVFDSEFQRKVRYFFVPQSLKTNKQQMLDFTLSLWWRILYLSRP